MDILLHAGRHKTGTTSLQRVLAENRHFLAASGWLYPQSGIRGFGHHELAERLSKRKQNDSLSRKEAKVIWTEIQDECRNGFNKIIISSEAFQNCSPRMIRSFFSGHDVKVIFYVRNKLDYLVSSYLQKVQATSYTGSLSTFYETKFRVNYKKFFSAWKDAFGDKCVIRVFERSLLEGEDVCVDFFNTFLPEIAEWERVDEDANPSMPAEVFFFKKALNTVHPEYSGKETMYSCMRNASIGIKGSSKFVPDYSVIRSVIKDLAAENSYLERETGVLSPFKYTVHKEKEINYDAFDKIKHFVQGFECIDYGQVARCAHEFIEEYFEKTVESPTPHESRLFFALMFSDSNKTTGADTFNSGSGNISLENADVYGDSQNNTQMQKLDIVYDNKLLFLPEASVIMPFGVVLFKDKIVGESLWMSKLNRSDMAYSGKDIGNNWLIDSDLITNLPKIDGSVLMCYSNIADNYFHWHFEVLAKLWEYIRLHGVKDFDYLYAGAFSRESFKYQSLLSIGIPERKILHDLDDSFEAKLLIYPALNSHVNIPLRQRLRPGGGVHHKGWNSSFCRDYPKHISKKVSSTHNREAGPARLFVNRLSRGTRNIINIDEVRTALHGRGFHEVDPGSMRFDDQVRLFSDAELVVGIHGAGMTNCLYCKEGSSLIELIPDGHHDVGYRVMAQIRGCDYYPVFCKQPYKLRKKPANDDMFVSLSVLESILDNILGRN